jgi:hypothetical protein
VVQILDEPQGRNSKNEPSGARRDEGPLLGAAKLPTSFEALLKTPEARLAGLAASDGGDPSAERPSGGGGFARRWLSCAGSCARSGPGATEPTPG